MTAPDPAIETCDEAPAAWAQVVDDGIEQHNQSAAPLHAVRPLASFAHGADGQVLGGAVGRTWGRCCELMQLWVAQDRRGTGLGSALLGRFEVAARERGCTVFYLHTFSFQAPAFYQRHGYRAMGDIAGYPDGIHQYLMHKEVPLLDAGGETSA